MWLVSLPMGQPSWKRKEVKTMYAKPEIAVLGDASSVILGNKVGQTDAIQPLSRRNPTDTELDD